jgi:hypothetical protein
MFMVDEWRPHRSLLTLRFQGCPGFDADCTCQHAHRVSTDDRVVGFILPDGRSDKTTEPLVMILNDARGGW